MRVYQREWETDDWNCILPSLRQAQQADKTRDREDSLSFLHLVGHSDLRGKGQWWKVPAGCRRPISTLTVPPYVCSNIGVQGYTSRTEQWQWRCWSRLEASLRFSHTEVLTHCALCQNCFQKGKKRLPSEGQICRGTHYLGRPAASLESRDKSTTRYSTPFWVDGVLAWPLGLPSQWR